MCGIFARINPLSSPVDTGACRRATHLLEHRGPDASGEWQSPAGDLFLGFRRLSILDLSEAANQPMHGADGSVLIFNGEIYNFRALRRELEGRGASFHTSGDTEVLLRAIETWGEDALLKFEGMFAFLYWNARTREALIARDFLGIKPLYLWEPPGGGLAVASELKAFYAFSDFAPKVVPAAVAEYLRFRSITGEGTLLESVSQLEPGQVLRYSQASGRGVRRNYWQPADAAGASASTIDDLKGLFRETVDRHLISDVPVGAQLSGGIDSSLTLAVAHRDLGRDMRGFHCSVENPLVNERRYAAQVAAELGVEMEVASLAGENFFSPLMDRLTWHMDEPIGHPNAIGVHLVSALARPKVTVLISGEGADESFAGYTRYSALLRSEALRRPGIGGAIVRALPPLNVKYYRALQKSGDWARRSTNEEIATRTEFLPVAPLAGLFGGEALFGEAEGRRLAMVHALNRFDALTRCQLFDLATYLPPLLIRQDKMSMAASIENRVPFVTPAMVRLGLSLPGQERATANAQKVMVKRLFTEYFSPQLAYRRKAGFTIPLGEWLKTGAGRERTQALGSGPLTSIMDRTAVSEAVAGANEELIWGLVSFDAWLRLFATRRAGEAHSASTAR